MLEDVCTDIDANLKLFLLDLLHKNGAKIVCGAKASRITWRGITYLKDGKKRLEEADSVVFAIGPRKSHELHESLVGKVPEFLSHRRRPATGQDFGGHQRGQQNWSIHLEGWVVSGLALRRAVSRVLRAYSHDSL